jgi:glycosyltransferase involved in cell wall biosynthesis
MKNDKTIVITAPSLLTKNNVSGVSSVANFIIANNIKCKYKHFEIGRKDGDTSKLSVLLRMVKTYCGWVVLMLFGKTHLVHFNFALSKAAIIRDAPLVLFAKLLGKKIVVHVHGGDYLFAKKAPAWMEWLLKKIFNGKTAVIVLSKIEEVAIKEKYPANKVYVLPNCVDLKDAKEFIRSNYEALPLCLLFIGRISNTKGLDFIYESLQILVKSKVDFKFIIAGAGPQQNEYVEKFSALLGCNFEFRGVVSGTAKTKVYQDSNVFLLPSLFEGLPMSLLEAMSFGLVPVVTNVGSIGTVVVNGQNGFITELDEKHTVQALVQAVTNCNNRHLLKQIGENAKSEIFKNFSPIAYCKKLNEIYAAA